MSLISRDAAIDVMCELIHHWFGGDPKDEIREIKRELEKLPSAQLEQRWTPVSEKLPEKNGRYLVTCEQWGAWEVDWNIWYTTPRPGWLWEKGITAWMPLPKPYQKEGD